MSNLPSSKPPQAQTSPAQSLLSGLAVKGKHMVALGCGGLVIVLVVCALSVWFAMSNFSFAADPTPTQRSQVGQAQTSTPDCESQGRRLYVQEIAGQLIYSCGW